MLDLSQLCISEGRAVWVLYADMVCLNDDGAVFDAALLSFVSALQNRTYYSFAAHLSSEGIMFQCSETSHCAF